MNAKQRRGMRRKIVRGILSREGRFYADTLLRNLSIQRTKKNIELTWALRDKIYPAFRPSEVRG